MTPEFILRCSINRMITKDGKGETDSDAKARRYAESEIDNLSYASGYAEPGYDNPKKGILFANWNYFPGTVIYLLEKYGYACEWSDEWVNCDDCYKALRTSPDSYCWLPSYVQDECDIICESCWREDIESGIEKYINDPDRALTIDITSWLEENGWKPVTYSMLPQQFPNLSKSCPNDKVEFENGFHQGQDDTGHSVYKLIREFDKDSQVLFIINSKGQFDMSFSAWLKKPDEEEN